MRPVYIGIQRGGGLIGWLIRLVTRSRFGHTVIAFDNLTFTADGRKGWGWLTTAEILTPTPAVIRFTALWRIFFPSKPPRSSGKKLFCSEGPYLCAVEASGIVLLGELEAWEVSPGHYRASSVLRREIPPLFTGPAL